jgi:hypothetical protein
MERIMSEIKDGGPAFPVTYEIENGPPDNAIPGHLYPGSKSTVVCSGLTVRDYFAAKAMQAIIAATVESDSSMTARAVGSATEGAYFIADEMLRARGQS